MLTEQEKSPRECHPGGFWDRGAQVCRNRALHHGLSGSTPERSTTLSIAKRTGPSYEYAEVELTYGFDSGNPFEVAPGALIVSESFEPSIEWTTLPYENFAWVSDGAALKPAEAPGRQELGIDYVITKFQRPSIPPEAFIFVGKVNDGTIFPVSMPSLQFGPEELLMKPPQIRRVHYAIGSEGFDITYRFSWRQNGWNQYFRTDTQLYDRLLKRATGQPYLNHELANFTVL